jgi:endonuclease/exonuclease/phosphatase family metal-dependent hydrolase
MLDATLPPKQLDHNLLIATWNIRAFGGLTRKWAAGGGDSPKRDLRAVAAIKEIVSRFDVVAIQETKSELTAIRELLCGLGDDWGMIVTDVTRGAAGNNERLAYVFDRRRVNPSGLAAELVVPTDRRSVTDDAFDQQFARTPYAVSFASEGAPFILVTLHVKFGSARGRVPELRAIARWLSEWAAWEHAFDSNIIALGDFNIDRMGTDLHRAFTSTGLQLPADLESAPRTIFGTGSKQRFYDQIAWFEGQNGGPTLSSIEYRRGGFVNFLGLVYPSLSKTALSWRISDHYPLWAEFLLRAN